MLTNDECKKTIKSQEENYYKGMANDTEEYLDYIAKLACNCYDAIFENEIYLVSNNEFNKTNIIGESVAKNKFDDSLEVFLKGEDFKNARLQLESIEYEIDKPNGFEIFYLKHNNRHISTVTVE